MNPLQPEQLTILTTSKCSARCNHCSMNSGPERNESLTYETICKTIDELHKNNPLKVIIFAGGEPTLLGDVLLDAIAYADCLGINTRLVTNAYWATSINAASKKVKSLREAGLAELNISIDDYHLPYIPIDRVLNAWNASKNIGFSAVIIANCYGPQSKITPDYIMDLLGETLPERFDNEGKSKEFNEVSKDGTLYAMSNAYLQKLGRARISVAEEEIVYPMSQNELSGGCPWAIKSAALSPLGHLVACCGIEAENNSILDFGSVLEISPQKLINYASDKIIINAISLLGPYHLKELIKTFDPEIVFKDKYATVCEICEDIVTRKETINCLNENIIELSEVVIPLRLKLEKEYSESLNK